ncbi:MAG: hypothetical protein UY99_C0004G0021 [Parcubacteria group bacterium GW2011_GWA1_59_11]|nr:MAG: hypothetical protein UY99_C0004G0021 [Parcubacteria group bacterium GW2011_GWA1_59_11]
MSEIWREFVSLEQRVFAVRLGRHLASALAGFVAGTIVASIIWAAIIFSTDILR